MSVATIERPSDVDNKVVDNTVLEGQLYAFSFHYADGRLIYDSYSSKTDGAEVNM